VAALLNDMMCHSVRSCGTSSPDRAPRSHRYGQCASRHTSQASNGRARITASSFAKTFGREVDYARTPSEDFASATLEFATDDGHNRDR